MTDPEDLPSTQGEILIYPGSEGLSRVTCRFVDGSLWLSQAAMVELYQTSKPNLSMHLKHLFEECELEENSVVQFYLTTAADGKAYRVKHYKLEVVIAVGYRVRSQRGTQFRQWATARLEEYLRKGLVMDDERLKNPPGPGVPDYFDEMRVAFPVTMPSAKFCRSTSCSPSAAVPSPKPKAKRNSTNSSPKPRSRELDFI